jgi:CHAT domain-containing protein
VAKQSPFDVAKLPEKISAFRDVLQDPEKYSTPLAREFYDAIVAPLAPALEQAKAGMIMFSLDGQLRYIPMSALYDGKQWLIQKYNVSLFNDATKAGLAVPGVGNWKVAGLGVTKEHKYGRGKFTALPAVRDELASIVRTKSNAAGVLNGVMTLDDGFTAEELQEVLETGYPVIHLASHFHFDKKNPEQSFLLLGDGTGLPLIRIESEDFKFKNVDLLALSACQTARGGVDASGKEIEGFGALAQKRGAKAVLATLWPVFDESTGLLMSNFYRLHEGGDKPSIATALRKAQLLMIDNKTEGKDFRQPFYWAPFVLMGDWR